MIANNFVISSTYRTDLMAEQLVYWVVNQIWWLHSEKYIGIVESLKQLSNIFIILYTYQSTFEKIGS